MKKAVDSTSPGALYGIEAFRGIAAVMVAVYHISRHFEQNFGELPFFRVTEFGHAGVDFFFTLSGFIIFYVHRGDIDRRAALRPYIAKRFARVYPFYWVMMLMTLTLVSFVASATIPGPFDLIKEILLWPKGIDNLVIGVSWTLQHEIVFYLLFALLIVNRNFGAVLMTLWFGAILAVNYIRPASVKTLPEEMQVLLSAFNIQFLMGMATAFVLVSFDTKKGLLWLGFGAAAFALTAAGEIGGYVNGYGKYARIFYGLSSMLLIIGVVTRETTQGLKIPFVGRILGRSSYAIYLSHLFFNGIYFKLLSLSGVVAVLPYAASAALVVLLVIVSACLLSALVELPLTRKTRHSLLNREP